MKKYLLILMALFSMMLVSCTQNSKLEFAVAALNSDCPQDWGDGITLESVKIEGDDVVYDVTFDENIYDVELLESNREGMKKTMLESYHSASGEDAEDMQALYEQLKGTDKGLLFNYVGDKSGKKVSIRLTHSELER